MTSPGIPSAPRTSPRSPWLLPAVAFAAAFAVRALYLLACHRAQLLEGLFLDSAAFARTAAAIRAGAGAGEGPYVLSPLYPYLLALFPGIAGEPTTQAALAVRVVQAGLGAGTCVLAAVTARRLGGEAVGWGAGLALAVFGPAVHYDAAVLVAGPQAFALALATYLAVAAGDPGLGARALALRWGGVGASLGVAAALRPTALAVLAAFLVVHVATACLRDRRAWGAALATLLGALLVVLPFTVRNGVVGGEPVLLTASGGFNFWVGNHADADGLFRAPAGYVFERDPAGRELVSVAEGRELGFAEASAWWRQRALDDIAADPGAWIALLGRKALLVLHPRDVPQLGWSFEWHRARAWPLRLPPSARWVLLLALAAPVVASLRGGRRRLFELRWPIACALAYGGALVLFFVTGRYRAPLYPAAIVLAASCVGDLVALARARRTAPLVVALGLVALTIGGSHVLYDGRFGIPDASGIEESQRGVRLVEERRFVEALVPLEAALWTSDSAATRAAYAEALRGVGRAEEAVEQYQRILERDADNALAWFNLGNLFWEDLCAAEQAVHAFRESVRADGEFPDAHFNLGMMLLQTRRFGEARRQLEEALRRAPPDTPWRSDAERALTIARQRELAENPR